MSDKPRERLNSIDRDIRKAVPVPGYFGGVKVLCTIERIAGFELFNTRRYHNYETWSDGWRVQDENVYVEREDLDDAVRAYTQAYEEIKAGRGPGPHGIFKGGARLKHDAPCRNEFTE